MQASQCLDRGHLIHDAALFVTHYIVFSMGVVDARFSRLVNPIQENEAIANAASLREMGTSKIPMSWQRMCISGGLCLRELEYGGREV